MPPQNYSTHPYRSPVPASPPSKLNITADPKYCQLMNPTKKKLIPTLVFVLIVVSLIRLLWITARTTYNPLAPTSLATLNACSSPQVCTKTTHHIQSPTTSRHETVSNVGALTEKEYQFLSHLISHRAPCNILVFGLEHQHLAIASLFNTGGTTIFLEDNLSKPWSIDTNSKNIQVKEVQYKTSAKEAYKLLEHARKNPGCSPNTGLRKVPRCKLALTELPKEVYELNWDVVIVDGPNGEGPENPGRMAAIYTASVLAREGNMTNVVVHDVDRMIEKWFSREFLCDENLVSSKGRFWNFHIEQQINSTRFCTA